MGFKMKGPSMNISYGGESAKQQKQNLNQDNPVAKHASAMNQLDPMHNGKPGVQKDDFEQFGSPATMVSPLNVDTVKPTVKPKKKGKAPKGALGSDTRKAEYDKKGWKYDDTIKGYNRDGSKVEKKVEKKDDKKDDKKVETKSETPPSKDSNRLKKTKGKAEDAKKDADKANDGSTNASKSTMDKTKRKSERLAKRQKRQEGRAARKSIRKSDSSKEDKKKAIKQSRTDQKKSDSPANNKGNTRNSGDAPKKMSAEDEAKLRSKNRARIDKRNAMIADKKAKKVYGSSSPATKKYKK